MSDTPTFESSVDTYVPTAEQLEKHFSALDDSVGVIDLLKAEGPREFQTAEEAAEEIKRNVDHLALMIEKDFIKNAGRSLAAYTAAIAKGS
jgi:tRNA A58 N-methylase Trm61